MNVDLSKLITAEAKAANALAEARASASVTRREFCLGLARLSILTPEAALRSFQNDYDKWTALVGRNMGMAQMLGLNGTPSYVVGRDLFPGVTPIPVLKRAVEAARKG